MPDRYTRIAILFHWLIALAIIGLLIVGKVMTGLGDDRIALKFELYQMHKSIGIAVLMLGLVRILWRFIHKPPAFPESMTALETQLARKIHMILLGLTILTPLAGWAIVSASPLEIPTELFGLIPWPHLPVEPGDLYEDAAKRVHEVLAALLAILALGHIAAALYHHFWRKDGLLARMNPFGGTE